MRIGITSLLFACTTLKDEHIAPEIGETILEEEVAELPEPVITEVVMETPTVLANTPLLIDYLTGRKSSPGFVKPVKGRKLIGNTWDAVHVIGDRRYTLYYSEDDNGVGSRLAVYTRLDNDRSGIASPTYIGTPDGRLWYVGDWIEPHKSYQYRSCPTPDEDPIDCVDVNRQDKRQREREWAQVNDILIAHYEGR